MASPPPAAPRLVQRRCRHCGTRVSQNADTCFMCGRELAETSRGWRPRLPDLSTVVIVILAGLIGWQFYTARRTVPEPAPLAEVELPPTLPPPTPTPTPEPTATPWPTATALPPAPEPFRHAVQANESLWSIAALYDVDLRELRALNRLTDDVLNVGQQLLIPELGAVREPEADQPSVVSSVNFTYEVQAGDNIISLAFRFGTTPEEIIIANDLPTEHVLFKGQELVIPIPQMSREVLVSSDLAPRTSNSIYPGPRLLGPADGALISRSETILFSWLGVDILAPNEWYVLRIWPRAGDDLGPPTVWTKANSHRLDSIYALEERGNQEFQWQVTVVRVVAPSIPSAPRELQSVTLSSSIWQFTWQ